MLVKGSAVQRKKNFIYKPEHIKTEHSSYNASK